MRYCGKVKKELPSPPGLQDAKQLINKYDEGLISNDKKDGVDAELTDGIVNQSHSDQYRSNHSVKENKGDDDADDPRDEGAVRLRH